MSEHHVFCRLCKKKMEFRITDTFPDGMWFCTADSADCCNIISNPEFLGLAQKIADDVSARINLHAPKVNSRSSYGCQYTLELVIGLLKERV